MTDFQLSELTQTVIDGQEDPAKALDVVWKIKAGNPYAKKCWNKILEVLGEQRKLTAERWITLNAQTPKQAPYVSEYKSQWIEATDGFEVSSNRIDNRRRDFKHSMDHF